MNQPFAELPSLHSVLTVLFLFSLQVTSGISVSTLEIRQERISRFYLRVEWTSTSNGFFCKQFSLRAKEFRLLTRGHNPVNFFRQFKGFAFPQF